MWTEITRPKYERSGLPLIYVNQVGGQDELVFDGASFVLDADRSPRAQATSWREQVLMTRWSVGDDRRYPITNRFRYGA